MRRRGERANLGNDGASSIRCHLSSAKKSVLGHWSTGGCTCRSRYFAQWEGLGAGGGREGGSKFGFSENPKRREGGSAFSEKFWLFT